MCENVSHKNCLVYKVTNNNFKGEGKEGDTETLIIPEDPFL